jgi:branched-chain amino acid transport system permease protein
MMMPAQLWFNALVLGGMYALLALGLGLIYNTTRLFDFSFGAIYVIGAYSAYQLFELTDLGTIPVILLSALVSTAVGVLLMHVVYRRLILRGTPFLGFAVATLGVAIVLENAIAYFYSPVVRTLEASDGIGTFETTWGGVRVTGVQLLILGGAVLAMAAFFLFFQRTRAGLDLRAVSSDAGLAEAKGVERLRSAYIAFTVGYLLAATSAVLITLENRTLQPSIGHEMVVIAIVGVLLGGASNTPAAAVGGFVLALASYQMTWWFGEQWARPIIYTSLIGLLLVRPQGMFGRKISFVGR